MLAISVALLARSSARLVSNALERPSTLTEMPVRRSNAGLGFAQISSGLSSVSGMPANASYSFNKVSNSET
ncbi:hypothetical protein D9M71_791580 [compost metagenome]